MQVISTHTQLSQLRSRITRYKFFVYRLKYIIDTQFLNDCVENDVEVAWGRASSLGVHVVVTEGSCGTLCTVVLFLHELLSRGILLWWLVVT